jgi:hypothetical protein
MIDTRAVAQEVQEQLTAAMNKGQERVRKVQEQVRKSQEQGREAVTGAIRTGNELARAFRPNIPGLPVPPVRVPSLTKLPDPAKLRASAQELADQMIATQRRVAAEVFATQRSFAGQFFTTQRNLADKAFHAASPLVAEGVSRLTKVVATWQDGRKSDHGHAADNVAVFPAPVVTEVAKAPTETEDAAGTEKATKAAARKTAAPKAAARKTAAPKAAARKTAAPKAAAHETAAPKATRARTAKADSAKPGSAATRSNARTRSPKK